MTGELTISSSRHFEIMRTSKNKGAASRPKGNKEIALTPARPHMAKTSQLAGLGNRP